MTTTQPPTPRKTREEVEALKANWLYDPIWDLGDEEGFEEYWDELNAFRIETKAEWEREYQDTLKAARARYGLADNDVLVKSLVDMQWQIDSLRRKIEKMQEEQ